MFGFFLSPITAQALMNAPQAEGIALPLKEWTVNNF